MSLTEHTALINGHARSNQAHSEPSDSPDESSPLQTPVADDVIRCEIAMSRRKLFYIFCFCGLLASLILTVGYVQEHGSPVPLMLPSDFFGLREPTSETPTSDLITNRFYECTRKVPRDNETEHKPDREVQLRKWLRLAADTFEAAEMPFHLNRGILLAWYRDCDPDYGGADIDFEIFHNDWDRPRLSDAWNATVPNGSWITHYEPNTANDTLPGSEPVIVQDAYRLWSTVHLIDMWVMHKMEHFWWISNLKAGYYYWFYPFKLAHARFLDVDFLVPEPPICYLIQIYGTTWIEHQIEHNEETVGATWGEKEYYVDTPPQFSSRSAVPPRYYEDPQNLRECYKDPRPFLKEYGIDEEWVPDWMLPAVKSEDQGSGSAKSLQARFELPLALVVGILLKAFSLI